MINLGVIGLSQNNGHPYSFSAIINGYEPELMKSSGWDGIYNYLQAKDKYDLGIVDLNVTHVWTQDYSLSKNIASSCKIPHICQLYTDFIGEVDGVILARDDYNNHLEIAQPFIDANIPIFIDKPLTILQSELDYFLPHIESGLVMSTSGLRYASELDDIRSRTEEIIGRPISISCSVINDWNKYGIHMIDAVFGAMPNLIPSKIIKHSSTSDVFTVQTQNEIPIHVVCLGSEAPVFKITFSGTKGCKTYEISNNFLAFKRTLQHFANQIKTGRPSVSPNETEKSIRTIIAGNDAEINVAARI